MKTIASGIAIASLATASAAAAPPSILADPVAPQKETEIYVRVPAGRIALVHVRVIDGTGSTATEDRTIVIEGSRISAVLPGTARVPAGSTILDMTGRTALPGLVGMHNHLYYIARPALDASGHAAPLMLLPQMTYSAPRLYLAGGVTTMRTTGSVEPYADLNLKRQIDAGQLPGPHLDVTGPYLEGLGSPFIQMHSLRDAEEARRMVEYWADLGVTSFKAYMYITRAELGAAIEAAHARGIKVTGHLCAVTYPEAIELGIDDLEHGFEVNTELDPGKKPDVCPDSEGVPTMLAMPPGSPAAEQLIRQLVAHHVAVTSTLPVFEHDIVGHAPLSPRMLEAMSPQAREDYLYNREHYASLPAEQTSKYATAFRNELGLEHQFVAAGGLLIAGPDPTGNGGVLPGFGDQREVELLVEAGFKPEEAIRIATLNGATYLGLADRIGSIAAGKDADIVVVKGNPAQRIADIEQVELVFKDGVGFDSQRLLDSVRGRYGQY